MSNCAFGILRNVGCIELSELEHSLQFLTLLNDKEKTYIIKKYIKLSPSVTRYTIVPLFKLLVLCVRFAVDYFSC